MTDATHAVTQSALEAFAREYFENIGGMVEEAGCRWTVSFPEHISVSFSDEPEFEVVVDGDVEVREKGFILTPESDFTQQLLEEASKMTPSGQVVVTHDDGEHEIAEPPWLIESELELAETTFNPYYDRSAVCTLVKVGVETVSKYQSQFLEAVVIDTGTRDEVPALATTILDSYFDPLHRPSKSQTIDEGPVSEDLDSGGLASLLNMCQEIAVDRVEPEINDIRRSATKSAQAEFDEYRQYQEQQLNDIRAEIESITLQLQKLADDADAVESRQKRVEALQQRRELQTKLDEIETERDDILDAKSNGFEGMRTAIFDRHALEITVSTVATTHVEYECGEVEFELLEMGQTESLVVPYGAGAGVLGTIGCPSCDDVLSERNYLEMGAGIRCHSCQP